MFGAIPIELIGENFWLKLVLVIGPSALIAGAAVIAARIARKSAVERQGEQLRHDSERQEKALAHDREMRERESTRTVIDEAMEVVHSVIPLFTNLEVLVIRLQDEMNGEGETGEPSVRDEALDAKRRCRNGITDLQLLTIRLRIRPGAESISESYDAVVKSYRKHLDALEAGIETKHSDEELAAIKAIDDEGTGLLAALMLSFQQWLAGNR